jgi:predicted nucleotidyltransferase
LNAKAAVKTPRKKSLKKLDILLRTNPNYESLRFKDKIPYIRDIILGSAKPGVIRKIYLFGSYADGRADGNSDMDVCILIGNKQDRSKISLKIAMNLYNSGIVFIDKLVYKDNQFYSAENPEGVEKTITKEGVLIYG